MIYQTTSYSEFPVFYGTNPLTANSFPINVNTTANKIIRIEGIRDVSLYSRSTYIFIIETTNNESIVDILATNFSIVSYSGISSPSNRTFTISGTTKYYCALNISAADNEQFYLELRLNGKLNTSANLIFSICSSPSGGAPAIIRKVGITIVE